MEIHQFQLKYLAEEDRILLRLNSAQNEQILLLMTRRYVKGLWPLLVKALELDPKLSHVTREAKQATMAFHHEQSMQAVDYSQQYNAVAKTYPLGEQPLLLTVAKLYEKEQQTILSLYPATGAGIEVGCQHPLLHCFYQHLPVLVKEAEWDLVLLTSPPAMTTMNPQQLN